MFVHVYTVLSTNPKGEGTLCYTQSKLKLTICHTSFYPTKVCLERNPSIPDTLRTN